VENEAGENREEIENQLSLVTDRFGKGEGGGRREKIESISRLPPIASRMTRKERLLPDREVQRY